MSAHEDLHPALLRPGCEACEQRWQDRVARGELAEPRATHQTP